MKSCTRVRSPAAANLLDCGSTAAGSLRSSRRSVRALLLTICLAACGTIRESARTSDVLGLELESGRTVKQFLSDSTLNIVMLMSASGCLSCSNDLNRWVEIAREHLGRATLVLSSNPATDVRDALIRLRLPYAIVHRRDERRALRLVPAIVVFRRGETFVMETRIAQQRRALLVDSGRRILSTAAPTSSAPASHTQGKSAPATLPPDASPPAR